MASENSSNQMPNRWELGVRTMKDDSKSEFYRCPESRQSFFNYEDMMRYVKYAKEAKLSIYSPNFRPNKRRKRGGLPAGEQLSGKCSKSSSSNQNKDDSADSDSASEAESVSSQAQPEAVLVLSQESTNKAPTPVKPESPKGMRESPKKSES